MNYLTKEKIQNIIIALEDKKTDDFVSVHKEVLLELSKMAIEKLEYDRISGVSSLERGEK